MLNDCLLRLNSGVYGVKSKLFKHYKELFYISSEPSVCFIKLFQHDILRALHQNP